MRGNRGAGRRWGWSEQFKRTRFPSIYFSFLHFPFNVVHFEILVILYCPCRLLFRESQLSVSEKRVPGDSSFRTGTTFHFLPLLISLKNLNSFLLLLGHALQWWVLNLPTASQVPANLIPVPSHDSARLQLTII